MVAALAGFLPQSKADVSLGSAGNFAVLGGSGVANTGNTVLNGDLGVYPSSTISGFGPGIVNGTTYAGGPVAAQAHSDMISAYITLMTETPNQTLNDLSGLTLTPGVYGSTSTMQLAVGTTLTLSGTGDFIFQIGSSLTANTDSSIVLTNGAQASNVFWVAFASATLGSDTSFNGSIIAGGDITFHTGASMSGSALSLNGTVNLDDNNISITNRAVVGAQLPSIVSAAAAVLATNATTGTRSVALSAGVNPNGLATAVVFQYGLDTNYAGNVTTDLSAGVAVSNLTVYVAGLMQGTIYHWRVIATNLLGATSSGDRTLSLPALYLSGDLNGDGVVDQSEMNAVLANYWPTSPWLQMTNAAGLGGTNVSFALTNSIAGAFSVEYSTNLTNWQLLGPATPRYEFTDTNAPAAPLRYYRLRWP